MELHNIRLKSQLAETWDLECLRYSSVWEDHRCLDKSVPERVDEILSIGSAGDNALSLLRHNPRRLVIVDLSPAQIALVELKLEGLRRLKLEEFRCLLGMTGEPNQRLKIFSDLRSSLSQESQRYWDPRQEVIASGIHTSGRLDSYFKKFRKAVLPLVWSAENLRALVEAPSFEEQLKAWQRGDLRYLEAAVTEFFSQTALSLEGRDPSQFVHVKQNDIGAIFYRRFLRLMETQKISSNPYVYYFLTGQPLVDMQGATPLFHSRDFEVLKSRVDVIELKTCSLESLLDGQDRFDFMNLSNIFEYLGDADADRMFEQLALHLNPHGRICYWTLLVDRRPSSGLKLMADLSLELSAQDQTWFYSDFRVAERSMP